MAILFFDSSAVVKRYIAEIGSQWVAGLMLPEAKNAIHIGVVTGAEVVAAFARCQRGGSLPPEQAAQAIAEFSDDWANLYDVISADRQWSTKRWSWRSGTDFVATTPCSLHQHWK